MVCMYVYTWVVHDEPEDGDLVLQEGLVSASLPSGSLTVDLCSAHTERLLC
jgi:hypothetical protein